MVEVFRGEIGGGFWVRGIVHDENFQRRGGEGLGEERIYGARKDGVAVVGADDRGKAGRGGGWRGMTWKLRGGGVGAMHEAAKHLRRENSTLNCGFGGIIRVCVTVASRDRRRCEGYSGG